MKKATKLVELVFPAFICKNSTFFDIFRIFASSIFTNLSSYPIVVVLFTIALFANEQ